MKKSAVLLFFILVLFLLGCSNQKNTETSNAVVGDASQNQSEIELDSIYAEPTPIPVVQATADDPVAAVANTSGLWGYVNTKGDWVIAPQYSEVFPFVDNVATVKTDTGWQLINKSNEIIAAFEGDIEVVDPGDITVYQASALKTNCTIFDGMIIIAKDSNGDSIITNTGDLFGYADITGKVILEPQYRDAKPFQEGLAAVNLSTSENNYDNLYGFIDTTGAVVIPPQFDFSSVFSDGVVRVQTAQDKILGCIDKTGQWLFSDASVALYVNADFAGGVAPARVGQEFGVIDQSGTVLHTVANSKSSSMYSDYCPIGATSFKEGLYPLMDISMPNTDDGFWPQGFIDMEGNFAIPAQTDWKVIQEFSDGMCCVFTGRYNAIFDNLYGYIDTTGKVVIPIQYSSATMFNYGYAIVGSGDFGSTIYSIIDKTGNTVAEIKDANGALPFSK